MENSANFYWVCNCDKSFGTHSCPIHEPLPLTTLTTSTYNSLNTLTTAIKDFFKKKYFTPEIEDIRVGYQCILPNSNKLLKLIYKDIENIYVSKIDLKQIKVPYLTKEQIEAENWKPVGFKKDRFFKMIDYGYGEVEVIIELLDNNIIMISSNRSVVFSGKCKDINTFRYITKLLNI